jgi:hypothetical protein
MYQPDLLQVIGAQYADNVAACVDGQKRPIAGKADVARGQANCSLPPAKLLPNGNTAFAEIPNLNFVHMDARKLLPGWHDPAHYRSDPRSLG